MTLFFNNAYNAESKVYAWTVFQKQHRVC